MAAADRSHAVVQAEWKAALAAWDAIEEQCNETTAPQPSSDSRRVVDCGTRANEQRPRKTRRTTSAQSRATTEDTDVAKCLSMHQPWASLLVAGIKTVEGRSWSTSYRGPLWIASTVKKCDNAAVDRFRQAHVASTGNCVGFPSAFPSASLLGRVDVIDCLQRDEWQRRVQSGDLDDEPNDSPFLFICTRPHLLQTPRPVRGMHRIWTLPAGIADAAAPDLLAQRRDRRQQRHATAVDEATAERKSTVAADPARTKVRTAFAKALSMDSLTEGPPARQSTVRAAEVESVLFATHNHAVSDAYKERARSLLFNMRDALNAPLRASVLDGRLPARAFVCMRADELANPKLQAANKALDAALLAELVLTNSGGCETEGMFMCPSCGCRKTHHFVDYKAQGRKAEVWGSGADEDATTMSRVRQS